MMTVDAAAEKRLVRKLDVSLSPPLGCFAPWLQHEPRTDYTVLGSFGSCRKNTRLPLPVLLLKGMFSLAMAVYIFSVLDR